MGLSVYFNTTNKKQQWEKGGWEFIYFKYHFNNKEISHYK